jgi:hypothetical protein
MSALSTLNMNHAVFSAPASSTISVEGSDAPATAAGTFEKCNLSNL